MTKLLPSKVWGLGFFGTRCRLVGLTLSKIWQLRYTANEIWRPLLVLPSRNMLQITDKSSLCTK